VTELNDGEVRGAASSNGVRTLHWPRGGERERRRRGPRGGFMAGGGEGKRRGGVRWLDAEWGMKRGGPDDRQRPGATEAGAGRATREQGRRGYGRVGPT
jgi:hypothetical protein